MMVVPGYGGSCVPKDTLALAEIGKQYGSPITLIEQTVKANDYQKKLAAKKVEDALGDLTGKQLAIVGLSFNPTQMICAIYQPTSHYDPKRPSPKR